MTANELDKKALGLVSSPSSTQQLLPQETKSKYYNMLQTLREACGLLELVSNPAATNSFFTRTCHHVDELNGDK